MSPQLSPKQFAHSATTPRVCTTAYLRVLLALARDRTEALAAALRPPRWALVRLVALVTMLLCETCMLGVLLTRAWPILVRMPRCIIHTCASPHQRQTAAATTARWGVGVRLRMFGGGWGPTPLLLLWGFDAAAVGLDALHTLCTLGTLQ